MRIWNRCLLDSCLVHLLAIGVAAALFELSVNPEYEVRDRSKISRANSIRLAVAMNRLDRVEKSLREEAPEEITIGYEDLGEMKDVDQVIEWAVQSKKRINEHSMKKLERASGKEAVGSKVESSLELVDLDSLKSQSASEFVSSIEAFALEAELFSESVKSYTGSTAQFEPPEAANIKSEDQMEDAVERLREGLHLVETLSYDYSVPSRFLQEKTAAGAWSYIDSWFVLGPIPAEHAFVANPADSDRIDVDLDLRLGLGRGEFRSWNYRVADAPAYTFSREEGNFVYYLYSELFSEDEKDTLIWLRGDRVVRLWLNESISPVLTTHPESGQVDYAKIHLKKGYNQLLLRVESGGAEGYLWVAHSDSLAEAIWE